MSSRRPASEADATWSARSSLDTTNRECETTRPEQRRDDRSAETPSQPKQLLSAASTSSAGEARFTPLAPPALRSPTVCGQADLGRPAESWQGRRNTGGSRHQSVNTLGRSPSVTVALIGSHSLRCPPAAFLLGWVHRAHAGRVPDSLTPLRRPAPRPRSPRPACRRLQLGEPSKARTNKKSWEPTCSREEVDEIVRESFIAASAHAAGRYGGDAEGHPQQSTRQHTSALLKRGDGRRRTRDGVSPAAAVASRAAASSRTSWSAHRREACRAFLRYAARRPPASRRCPWIPRCLCG